ncbi:uncharacterized protein TNCV_24921 [Trichonephila clavipes]|uniref:Uncharacterized protein n=1 Tax=Trichonephila clavipes TaxID=2585209 RepID=A0A8X6W1I7_TRICX|nr:uncharacterized protein TNCV_24921 [Trichonephila clavipes]
MGAPNLTLLGAQKVLRYATGQRYPSEIYLADNMLYEDQTIQITASYEVWMMTKSIVNVAAIVGYNRCPTPRHRIEESLDVSLGYKSPRVHAASTYCQS